MVLCTQVNMMFASIPKFVGSIPTVARHIFQACPVWIYTQINITDIISQALLNWSPLDKTQ